MIAERLPREDFEERVHRWDLDLEAVLESLLEGNRTLKDTKQFLLEYFIKQIDDDYSTTALCLQNYSNIRIMERIKYWGGARKKICGYPEEDNTEQIEILKNAIHLHIRGGDN